MRILQIRTRTPSQSPAATKKAQRHGMDKNIGLVTTAPNLVRVLQCGGLLVFSPKHEHTQPRNLPSKLLGLDATQ